MAISSVNSKNALQELKYRYKRTADSTYSDYIAIENNTDHIVTIDKLFAWDFEVVAADKFDSTTYNFVIAKGVPIVFFDNQKLSVGINKFPSGSNILETTNLLVDGNTSLKGENMIFEAGTWTPSIRSRSGTNPTYTVQYRYGRYKRINNLCYVTFHGKWTISNAGTDYACITGLPYVASNNMNGQSLTLHEQSGAITGPADACAWINDYTATLSLQRSSGMVASQWQTGDVWIGYSGFYVIQT